MSEKENEKKVAQEFGQVQKAAVPEVKVEQKPVVKTEGQTSLYSRPVPRDLLKYVV